MLAEFPYRPALPAAAPPGSCPPPGSGPPPGSCPPLPGSRRCPAPPRPSPRPGRRDRPRLAGRGDARWRTAVRRWPPAGAGAHPAARARGPAELAGELRALAGPGRGEFDHLVPHPAQAPAQLDEHLGGHPLALPDQAEQDVLGADVVVVELQRLPQRELEHLLGARGERDVAGRRPLAPADDLCHLLAHRVLADVQLPQRLRRDAVGVPHQPEQQMLGPDVVVVEVPGFFLRKDDDSPRPLGEPLEHLAPLGWGGDGPRGPRRARAAGVVTSRGRRSAARRAGCPG